MSTKRTAALSQVKTQDVLTKCTSDFHSQVTLPLKNVLANALLTFTHKLTSPPRLCLPSVTFDFHSQSTQDVLASAPLTFTHKSSQVSRRANQVHLRLSLASHFTSQDVLATALLTFTHKSPRTCYPSAQLSSSHKPAHCCLRLIRDRLATVAHLFSWCSNLARVSLILPVGATGSMRRSGIRLCGFCAPQVLCVGWIC